MVSPQREPCLGPNSIYPTPQLFSILEHLFQSPSSSIDLRSFLKHRILLLYTDILDEEPREGFCRHTVPEDAPPPGPITTLKLNNNAFTTLNKFSQFLVRADNLEAHNPSSLSMNDRPHLSIFVQERLLWEPAKLSFIDLSFNGFQEIPSQLQELPNLSVLYLHGNEIQRLKEVGPS